MARSEYNYLQPSELAQYIHTMSGVTNEAQAALFISDAEVIVDRIAGGSPHFYQELTGSLDTAVASGVTTWPGSMFGSRRTNYWAKGGAYVEITECTDADLVGLRRLAIASTTEQVTLVSGFDAVAPSGTQFIFRQLSIFPRLRDQDLRGDPRMPPELKRAVAYQVEHAINMGSEAFGLSDTDWASDPDAAVQSRTYGSGYSESRVAGQARGLGLFAAPKMRLVMRRLMSSTGRLTS